MDIPEDLLSAHTDQSISSIHHILRSSRRRLAIILISHRVLTTSPPAAIGRDEQSEGVKVAVSVREIAKEITAIEQEVSLEEATGGAYRNVYTSLIQTHLPRLADANIIRYDSNRKTIEPGKNLLALSVITAVTSPITQMLFYDAIGQFYVEQGPSNDSIGD